MISKLLTRLMIALLPLPALAIDPAKPVEWVVGYAPGGGSDVVARMLAEILSTSGNTHT